ncbi:MAG: acetolactate synthase [Candidatus Methanofastidiosa archaeon]|nr:acetolactate synthase [Candidatus Methanofastidiosa archaeon]
MDVISVFIQNRPGRLSQILKEVMSLKLYGFSIADAGEFGVVRLCLEDPHKAVDKLKRHDLIAHVTPAIAIEDNKLMDVIEIFERRNINIDEAIYAVNRDDRSLVVLKVSDTQRASSLLEEEGIETF